ncbi:MAG: NUDIX domain-containing protein [Candidatus Woesearchaeota archaeon]
MTESKDRPKVGCGILIIRENKVLLGKRHDKRNNELHAEGTWTCPGGKQDYQEKMIDCIKREVAEETSLVLAEAEVISVSDDMVHDNHYVTIGFLATKYSGESKVMEPEKITEWKWFSLTELPYKVYPPSKKLIDNYLNKETYRP